MAIVKTDVQAHSAINAVRSIIKKYGVLYLFALGVTIICWGQNALTHNVRIDVGDFVNNPGTMQAWMDIGRWGFVLLKNLAGTTWFNPYYSGILFIFLWPLSAVIWVALFERAFNRRLRFRLVFVAGYLVAHWWSYIFYFQMMSAGISLSVTLIAIAYMVLLRTGGGVVRPFNACYTRMPTFDSDASSLICNISGQCASCGCGRCGRSGIQIRVDV